MHHIICVHANVANGCGQESSELLSMDYQDHPHCYRFRGVNNCALSKYHIWAVSGINTL